MKINKARRLSIFLPLLLMVVSVTVNSKEFYISGDAASALPKIPGITIEYNQTKPLISKGNPGEWDDTDILNPSVIKFKDIYVNYYSGYDGKSWKTGISTSKDGVSWVKYTHNPILAPNEKDWDTRYISANGGAIVFNKKIYYAYQGVDSNGIVKIGIATSDDTRSLVKYPQPVLSPGPSGAWDSNAVADPYLISHDDALFMYYLGQDRTGVQRLGVARSTDGIHWEKSIANPIMDVGASGTFDENGLGEPGVIYIPPYYHMLYTGRDATEKRNLGYAVSTNGINWKKASTQGIIDNSKFGGWASRVICDPTFIRINNQINVLFGGGNVASPDENLNGQIGSFVFIPDTTGDLSRFSVDDIWPINNIQSNDFFHGSYEIEHNENKNQAWISKRAHMILKGKTTDFIIKGWVPAQNIISTTKKTNPVDITVKIEGNEIYHLSTTENELINVRIPYSRLNIDNSKYYNITVETSGSTGKDIADKRELAMIVNFIGFE